MWVNFMQLNFKIKDTKFFEILEISAEHIEDSIHISEMNFESKNMFYDQYIMFFKKHNIRQTKNKRYKLNISSYIQILGMIEDEEEHIKYYKVLACDTIAQKDHNMILDGEQIRTLFLPEKEEK